LSSTSLLTLFALAIGLGAFSNWARLSLLSLRPSRFRELFGQAREGKSEQESLKKAESLLLSVLVAANAARVAAPLLIFTWLGRLAPEMAVGWRAVIAFLLAGACVLLLCELVPRVVLSFRREPRMRFSMLPLSLLNVALLPVTLVLQRISSLIGKLFGRKVETLAPWPLRVAGAMMWDANGRESQLEEDERVLISSIFDMSETIVREVMVPRVDMRSLEQDKTLAQAREEILETGHSRFPVSAENVDNMVGLFLAKDLLRYSSEQDLHRLKVKDIMHPITFVPETKNVSDLLREFQQNRQHMAVAVDEYGNTAGLVTIEDVLEEIVGEIEDEFDKERKLFVETKDGGYIVDAKMSIGDVAEEIGVKLPENSEYDTIGGFVVTALGKVPQQGEAFQSNGVAVTVLEADGRRIHKVKLMPLSEEGSKALERRGSQE
jgi:putative hemolysin